MDVRGRQVTVMGLGRHGGGVGATRYLAEQGAAVTVTDLADESQLADSLRALADLPALRYRLGQHDAADFRDAEIVVVNPAVKPGNSLVALARGSGAIVTSETELFLSACPARVIGVTGSNGKSSTCSMLAEILSSTGRRHWLGGNIGRSLLGDLPHMSPDDVVVLELSSFQLWWLSEQATVPTVGVVLNCAANHLDWHGTYEHYAAAKQRLLTGHHIDGVAVLNTHDEAVSGWTSLVRGVCLAPWPLERVPPLAVVGDHQRINAACAAAAAAAVGCSGDAICRGLAEFRGLPHRLQFVAEVAQRRFYNDSKATTPEATIAALAAFDRKPWLLAGGSDKGVDFTVLAETIVARAAGAAFYGATGESLREAVARLAPEFPGHRSPLLSDALGYAWQQSRPGDTILLSPACASFDQFRDFKDRGRRFVEQVHTLARDQDAG